jgi:outer membrane lipase/esterase
MLAPLSLIEDCPMFRRALLFTAVSATCSNGHAADFSNTYFFGDSLSDAGTFSFLLPSGIGKFTTNPGPVWTENLAAALGTEGRPAVAGGTNFAQGGARVTQLPGVPETNVLTANALPVRNQVSVYLALAGHADPGALYSVWGGANDLLRAADPNQPESADPLAYMVQTAGELVGEIGRLQAAGARYVLVPNLPNGAITPFGVSLGPANAAALTGLVGAYNQTLFGGLAASGIRVVPLDIFTLLDEIVATPATYGLVNVTVPACGATPSLLCTAADLVAPDAAQTFLFADGVHPTTAGHRLISDYALSILRAPAAISLLAESPLDTRAALFRTIYDQATLTAPRSEATTRVWGSAGGGRLKYQGSGAQPEVTGEPLDFAIGIDHSVSPQFTLGAAFAASRIKPDFAKSSGGGFQQDERALALYAAYRSGRWHMSAVAAVGKLDFDTRRTVPLGPATRSIEGSTAGRNRSLGLVAGFDSSIGAVKHGPLVGVQAQRVKIDGFAEDQSIGESSTAMSFGEQKRESRVGSLGYQISYEGGLFVPYARLTLDHEFKKSERQVTASLQTVPGNSFELPAQTPDRSYATATVGVGIQLAPSVNVNLALTDRVGQDKVRAYAAQAVLSVGF